MIIVCVKTTKALAPSIGAGMSGRTNPLHRFMFNGAELGHGLLDCGLLLHKCGDALVSAGCETAHLFHMLRIGIIEIEELLDLPQ